MDDYGRDVVAGGPPDEYAALADARQVMTEVLALVEDLHGASTRLGDALVGAGLPAREWRGADCRLLLLSDQFPDITLDDVVTRLAEFSAGMGPHWLHGGMEDIARFNEEASILYGVARPLRVVAQRLRMLPARERGDFPLERAIGDPRVGTPLDRVVALLRDLESLGSYIQPLTPEEWNPPAPNPAPNPAPQPWPAAAPASGQTAEWAPAQAAPDAAQSLPQSLQAPPPSPSPSPSPSASQALAFRRLRDFMPPAGSRPISASPSRRMDWRSLVREAAAWLRPRKWLVLGITIMVLALGTALLALASQSGSPSPAVTSHLVAAPAKLTFACSGKGASLSVSLRNTGIRPLSWTAKAPAGLGLSTTHSTIQPKAAVAVQVHVTAAKAAKGTLTFTSNDGDASIPYTVTCK